MNTQELKKIKIFIIITGVTFASSIIGLITDLTAIFTSNWFDKVVSSNIVLSLPYITSFALLCLVIYEFKVLKKKTNEINRYYILRNKHWERMIRIFRSILLDNLNTPTIKDTLDPLLDELSKRLPEHGVDFKMSIAIPLNDGSFSIIASRGMDPASIQIIEQRSNWKERKSFFSNGLSLDEDQPFAKYASGTGNYENIQRPTGVGNSKSHFVIAIKNSGYKKELFPEHTLAVLSIGIPIKHSLKDNENEAFYNNIYPIIKTIEAILLLNLLTEKKH